MIFKRDNQSSYCSINLVNDFSKVVIFLMCFFFNFRIVIYGSQRYVFSTASENTKENLGIILIENHLKIRKPNITSSLETFCTV